MRSKTLYSLALCVGIASASPTQAFFWDDRDLFPIFGGGVRDTFCRDYRRIVLTREDLAQIRAMSRSVRNRIQVNDLTYLCRCEGFRSSWCNMVGPSVR